VNDRLRTALNLGFWVLALAYCVAVLWAVWVVVASLVEGATS
jgi:hypothetical protein